MTRRTGDKLGFIVQLKINQMFEYSSNPDENLKELSLFLTYRGGTKFYPLLWVVKTL